jgi:hypothetical protein
MNVTSEDFGREVLGPIIGEFCMRLWAMGSLLEQPHDAAMLFCARGGLRMMLAYERFLAATVLPIPTKIVPFMISRVAAIRPVLMRTVENGNIPPSAASTLSYEFANRSLREVVFAMSGCDMDKIASGTDKFTPEGFASLMMSDEGKQVFDTISEQSDLVRRHLDLSLNGRRHAILVDTGLFATTMQLLGDGMPDINFSSALIARANYRGRRYATPHHGKTFGLSVDADNYSPLQRRSAILRYWHLIESTLEPDLPSVRIFADEGGIPVSNLEIPGWRSRIEPSAGSAFSGIMDYLGGLSRDDPSRVTTDARMAWKKLRHAFVWPTSNQGNILDVGIRGNNFGLDETTDPRPWKGSLNALRGHALWREGEIARSRTPMRLPMLAAIEAAYGVRKLKRKFIWGSS